MAQKQLPSRIQRQKMHGVASQLSYEAKEASERHAMKAFLASQRATGQARAAKAAKRRAAETGANAGTMGGSRATMRAFMGGR